MSRAILGSGRDNTRSDDGAQLSRDMEMSKAGKQLMKSWNNGPLFLSIIAALRIGYMDLLSEVSLPYLLPSRSTSAVPFTSGFSCQDLALHGPQQIICLDVRMNLTRALGRLPHLWVPGSLFAIGGY